MLEQRRAKEKGYITLKEAAAISNYTPDYIGQLIRAGKIRGEQVYSNVAWVTTEDELNAYLENKGRTVTSEAANAEFLARPLFKYLLYGLIAAIAVLLLMLQYILYVSIDSHLDKYFTAHAAEETVDL